MWWGHYGRGFRERKKKQNQTGLVILCTSTAIWQKWQSRKWRRVVRKLLWHIFSKLVISSLESLTMCESTEYTDAEPKKNIRNRKLYLASKGSEIPPTCFLHMHAYGKWHVSTSFQLISTDWSVEWWIFTKFKPPSFH